MTNTTELLPQMMPLISNINILDWQTSIICIVIGIGISLAFYDSIQDSIGIFTITQIFFLMMGLQTQLWLVILASFVYGLMVISAQKE